MRCLIWFVSNKSLQAVVSSCFVPCIYSYAFGFFLPVIFLPPLSIMIDTLFALLLSFTYVVFCKSFLPITSFVSFLYVIFVKCCNLLHLHKQRLCMTWNMFCVESTSALFWMRTLNGEGITKLICQDHSYFPDIFIHWLKQKHLKRMIF